MEAEGLTEASVAEALVVHERHDGCSSGFLLMKVLVLMADGLVVDAVGLRRIVWSG